MLIRVNTDVYLNKDHVIFAHVHNELVSIFLRHPVAGAIPHTINETGDIIPVNIINSVEPLIILYKLTVDSSTPFLQHLF